MKTTRRMSDPSPFCKKVRSAILLLICLTTGSCTLPSNEPLQVLRYPAAMGIGQETPRPLVIFLRGKSGSHRLFEEQGLVQALQEAAPGVDIVAPDTHFGYFMARTVVDRLKQDVIDPAKEAGYRDIWLVGVSLGGLGSLLYSEAHPEDVSGVVLLAPYLGEARIIDEIQKSGLADWNPDTSQAKDWQVSLWRFLQRCQKDGFQKPPLLLAYGNQDRYGSGQDLLGECLPTDRVLVVEGAHDNPTFASAWSAILHSSQLRLTASSNPALPTP
jgi:pimeloyl-ACP methyl ester carboxylesterase